MVKIVIPHVEIHGVELRRLRAPQLPGGETHGIQMLRFLAEVVRVRIGKEKDSAIGGDFSSLAPRVARQTEIDSGQAAAGAPHAAPRLTAESARETADRRPSARR